MRFLWGVVITNFSLLLHLPFYEKKNIFFCLWKGQHSSISLPHLGRRGKEGEVSGIMTLSLSTVKHIYIYIIYIYIYIYIYIIYIYIFTRFCVNYVILHWKVTWDRIRFHNANDRWSSNFFKIKYISKMISSFEYRCSLKNRWQVYITYQIWTIKPLWVCEQACNSNLNSCSNHENY